MANKKSSSGSTQIPSNSDRGVLDKVFALADSMWTVSGLIEVLKEDTDTRRELSKLLGKIGIRSPISAIDYGRHAFGFITSNHQFVRITSNKEESAARDENLPPTVLKPLAKIHLEKVGRRFEGMPLWIEIFPEVQVLSPEEVTDDDIRQLVQETAAHGYMLWDPGGRFGRRQTNIGRLSDGTLVTFDPGAVCTFSEATSSQIEQYGAFLPEELAAEAKRQAEEKSKIPKKNFFSQVKKWAGKSSRDYEAAQAAHVKAMGLEYGKVSGVIPADKIDEYRSVLIPPSEESGTGKDSVITRAMLEGRYDEASWSALMEKALPVLEKEGTEAWRTFIREESKKRGKKTKE